VDEGFLNDQGGRYSGHCHFIRVQVADVLAALKDYRACSRNREIAIWRRSGREVKRSNPS
jgi:hypothetical protein